MGNQFREWMDEEIKFLKDNYEVLSDEQLGIELVRTISSIKTKRNKLKLQRTIKNIPISRYSDDFAREQLINIFKEIKRPPTKEDAKQYKMKPARDWYVEKYGSIENACVSYGLIEKPLTIEERMEISILELVNIAEQLGRVPYADEYIKMKNKGYSEFPLQKHFNMTYTEICDKYLINFKEIIPEGNKKCSICKEVKSILDYGIDSDASFGIRSSCRVCDYIKRNGLVIPEGWTQEECIVVIDMIINEKIKYINELCLLNPNKTLDDFVDLLNNHIKICNKPLDIKVYCMYCSKEEIKVLSVYTKNKTFFCSHDCYWKYKREFEPKGEEHPSYNRIKIKCDNCNKEIEVIPYTIENNKNNFCSQECYWEFRSKYYVGENHPQYGIERTKEQRQKQRILTTKMYSDGIFDRQTKPQKIVNSILEELKIKFTNEYNCKYYAIDNYLDNYNLMIEVMGDYFHMHPMKYTSLELANKMQLKNLKIDKSKRTYIRKYKNIDILYLWESDINNNPHLIKTLILEYVNNKGLLEDYNSFNYSIKDGNIIINNIIVRPYIDISLKKSIS